MDDVIRLKIDALVYEGYGISRLPDGKAVFVPFVMPGEEVNARIIEEKRGHAIAELISVENPHPQRTQPRCTHFGDCGGCHYQHIPYTMQLDLKKEIFAEQLQRLAGIESPEVKEIVPSAADWNYRNVLQFSLNSNAELCFSDFYRNQPFPIRECYLPLKEIDRVWRLAEFERGLDLERIEYRVNEKGDMMLILHGGGQDVPELASESSLSIVHQHKEDQIILAGDGFLVMQIGGHDFKVSAGSFFQTNYSGAESLARMIQDIILGNECHNVLDVYSGVGFFSAFLAAGLESITGVETSDSACEDFINNLDEFSNVSLYRGKAEYVLPQLEDDYDCILVDPPRAGLKKEVTRTILDKTPSLLIYVSCNPSTMARDARHLNEAGYDLQTSIIVDMFPQTFHIESVNIFRK